MKFLIILILILGAIITWRWIKRAAKKDALIKLEDFNIDEQYIAVDFRSAIALDNKKEKICILDHQSKPYYYKYEDIYNVKLNETVESKIKRIQLKIGVNNDKIPHHLITFLNTPASTKGFLYQNAHKRATYWKDKLEVLIERGKRIQSQQKVKSVNSVSDELIKLNELKEKGILTEEEFLQQKTKLLSK